MTSFCDSRDLWEGAGSNEGKDRPARTVSKGAPSVSDREDPAMLTTTLSASSVNPVGKVR